jgi:hypothetical protein
LDIIKIEQAFRDAALAIGNKAFLAFLSGLPEQPPICSECGNPMINIDKREKNITGMLGDGELSRTYYGCEKCHTHAIPKDEMLGISGTSFTPGVRRSVARLAASESFESCSQLLWELCGVNICSKDTERIAESIGAEFEKRNAARIASALAKDAPSESPGEIIPTMYIEYDGTGVPIVKRELSGTKGKQADGSAKTREMKLGCIFTQTGTDDDGHPVRDKDSTTYFSSIEQADDFGGRLYAEALRRGVGRAEKIVVIGDGAKWIWNLANLHFPSAVQIVDLFHAKEHIWNLIRTVVPDGNVQTEMKKRLYGLLEAGDIGQLVKSFSDLQSGIPDKDVVILREIGYFNDNAARMDYAVFKKQHLFVGSGVIEAGCKNVIGKRLKQSGMHWTVKGANSIAALRCAVLSGAFDYPFPNEKASGCA